MKQNKAPFTDLVMWLYDLAIKHPEEGQAHRERLRDICEFYELLVQQSKTKAQIEELKQKIVSETRKVGELKTEIAILKAIKEGDLHKG